MPSQSVLFVFNEDTSEEDQNRLTSDLLESPGVYNVGLISPNSISPSLRRMWYAEVSDPMTATALIVQLRQQDNIESAEILPERNIL
jgi:hypothetical protein